MALNSAHDKVETKVLITGVKVLMLSKTTALTIIFFIIGQLAAVGKITANLGHLAASCCCGVFFC